MTVPSFRKAKNASSLRKKLPKSVKTVIGDGATAVARICKELEEEIKNEDNNWYFKCKNSLARLELEEANKKQGDFAAAAARSAARAAATAGMSVLPLPLAASTGSSNDSNATGLACTELEDGDAGNPPVLISKKCEEEDAGEYEDRDGTTGFFPYIEPGTQVTLSGLVRTPQLNGAIGVVIGYDDQKKKYAVFDAFSGTIHFLKSNSLFGAADLER